MIDQTQTTDPVDLSKYIEVRLFQDRPHIRGKRIPVATIVKRMRANGWTVAETAYDFSLSESEVVAAILYYEEHQGDIERQETIDSEQFDHMKRIHGG
jgi:uncharacterized protein (DUF433 family)